MPRKTLHTLLLLASLIGPAPVLAAPSFVGVTANTPIIDRLEKFELTFTLSGTTYTNPFDPAQVDVHAVFTSPSAASVTVTGFHFREYTRSGPPEGLTAGAASWKVRFSPRETGDWSYQLSIQDAGAGSASWGPGALTCVPSDRKGYLRVAPTDPRYFQYDDGAQYIPIGENVAWAVSGGAYGGGTFNYDAWIPRIAAQGGNFARFWMCPWYHSIEWQSTGLGDYTNLMHDAWRLDYDLELARSYGLQVMLCLLNHGSVSSTVDPNWPQNPYNAANGGPCATPRDFFTNATARAFWIRHLRYCVARWGYASNLIWEMCNEINLTDEYGNDAGVRSDVTQWIHDMAVTLKGMDQGPHLVTNSYSQYIYEPAVWMDPVMDFTQIHLYNGSSALEDVARSQAAQYRASYPSKPVFLGEFGVSASGSQSVTLDPDGIALHNTMWGNLLGETAGSGASWWWDNFIDPRNLYTHYRGLSNFAGALDFPRSGFVYAVPAVTTATYLDLTVRGNLPWGVQAPANDFTVNANGTLSPDANSLSGYLYGLPGHPEYYNGPVTFRVNYPLDGFFRVNIGSITPYPPVGLRVNLDGGADEFNAQVTAQSVVSVAVPSGPHLIVVDNTLQDWFQASYTFSPYASQLKAAALQGPATVAAWIVNRNYNHTYVRANGLPPAAPGTIRFSGLAADGSWGMEWWDPCTGALAESGSATSSGGVMEIAVPPTSRDRALILRYGAPPLPTSTIPPTATPTGTPVKTGRATAFPNVLTLENPKTVFRVQGPGSTLRASLYTLAGERIDVVEGVPGESDCEWDSSPMASGLYLAVVDVVEPDGRRRREILKCLVVH